MTTTTSCQWCHMTGIVESDGMLKYCQCDAGEEAMLDEYRCSDCDLVPCICLEDDE